MSEPSERPVSDLRSYAIVTAGYWSYTLTDGALRMLTLLHFHSLGYSGTQLSLLFLLYEALGVVTNLLGGWVSAKTGVRQTLVWGLVLQVVALGSLALLDRGWPALLQVTYVVLAQGLSGIAKDLTKVSAKSAVKMLVAAEGGLLFKWVAALTGSKNTLKGVGFFLGSLLLTTLGFEAALVALAASVTLALGLVRFGLHGDLGKTKRELPMKHLLAKSSALNWLSLSRFFLFGARDVWFVVALPVFLHEHLGWGFVEVGSYMALWVIGYGGIQIAAPRALGASGDRALQARNWAFALTLVTLLMAAFVWVEVAPGLAVVGGLLVFGAVFAVNSSLHSYLVLEYADAKKITADVGFYYTANAAGRLLGCALSGVGYQFGGMFATLGIAAALLLLSSLCNLKLPAVLHGKTA